MKAQMRDTLDSSAIWEGKYMKSLRLMNTRECETRSRIHEQQRERDSAKIRSFSEFEWYFGSPVSSYHLFGVSLARVMLFMKETWYLPNHFC